MAGEDVFALSLCDCIVDISAADDWLKANCSRGGQNKICAWLCKLFVVRSIGCDILNVSTGDTGYLSCERQLISPQCDRSPSSLEAINPANDNISSKKKIS